jgi:hypothetical protein
MYHADSSMIHSSVEKQVCMLEGCPTGPTSNRARRHIMLCLLVLEETGDEDRAIVSAAPRVVHSCSSFCVSFLDLPQYMSQAYS